jgi:branched-chain amino acid aminotransferase
MGMESKVIWMNGELVPFEKATVHFLTPALHYGLGFLKAFVVTVQIRVPRSFA